MENTCVCPKFEQHPWKDYRHNKQRSRHLLYLCYGTKKGEPDKFGPILQPNSFSKHWVIFTLEACGGGTMCRCVVV